MSLLQVEINDKLKKAIKKKANLYGISSSALIRIVLVKTFIEEDTKGNVFNAERDNNGKGIPIDDLIKEL